MQPIAIVASVAALLLLLERRRPGRAWPKVPGWLPRAVALNALQAAVIVGAGVALDPWLARVRPWSADRLGIAASAALAYVAITFVFYWWHRARHASPFLWRWLHQLHHSPRRIEIWTSFYKHPIELVLNALLSAAVSYLVVGAGPRAAAIAATATGLAELVYHMNVATPRWLGWFLQRPESHCVHHETGRHAGNYGDLPLWDWLFGTLRDPDGWNGRCGFDEERERRVGAMLAGVDVERDAAEAAP